MKPEDVPQAWVQEAVDEADALVLAPRPIVLARQIIAAVAPMIAAAEREACAKLMEAGQPFVVPGYGGGSGTVCHWWAADAAAAIRAREEVK